MYRTHSWNSRLSIIMTNTAPSEKVVELFKSFRDSETELDQLKQSLRQKTQSTDKVQRDLGVIQDRVAQMEAEHRELRKTLVKSMEQNSVIEGQLSKEKDKQFSIYVELVQLEEQKKHHEDQHLIQQLELAKQLKQQSATYSTERQSSVEIVRQGLKNSIPSARAQT